ncbi:insulinase family protein [Cytophagales bacterium LB-30]|uniref:Insulinase family protein n=1 Tax=Shiella aurantiaca TaxID=3058365 RepID=A0ABT8F629_9BACT|nr:insulinase family protein [Shiella aurantiaca]MDN4165907.1 insulinase family protein [Shiella aurantiaca]
MRTNLIFLFIFLSYSVNAQLSASLRVEHFTLQNGLKVYLNQDTTASNVFGGILVRAGSIHESPDATGISHYLEHMLFKGNRKFGTTDFESENVHYQNIINLYRELEKASGRKRKKIQEQINAESIAAAKYGLPNEFSTLMKSIGSTQVSAFADYDVTFYYSYFPAHNIEYWLDINAERMINPVFRTFQSELEVVYEEKNRWDDDYENAVYVASLELLYPDYTYGLWPTIGKTEHLKNPSLTKMHEFFNKHYVADNMVLILTGNFDINKAKQCIETSFHKLQSADYEPVIFSEYQPFIGEQRKEISVTPFPMVGLLFPIKSPHNKDRPAIDVVTYLLSNKQRTGVLDKLEIDNKVQKIYTEIDDHALASSYNIYAIPNDDKSFDDTKSLILEEIRKLNDPSFFIANLQGAKQNLIKDFWLSLEDLETRALLITSCDLMGKPWEEALNYPYLVDSIHQKSVTRIVKQYFENNYGLLISNKGNPKKDEIQKPTIEPIPILKDTTSLYGQHLLDKLSTSVVDPMTIDFSIADTFSIGSNTGIAISNTINDLFSLEIRLKIGWQTDPKLQQTIDLLSYMATSHRSKEELKSTLESLACHFDVSLESNEVIITIDGLDRTLQDCLRILREMLTEPKVTLDMIESLYNSEKVKREAEKSSPFQMGFALIRYAVFGNQTKFLTRTPIEEIKRTDPDVYEKRITELLQNPLRINYFGSKSKEVLKSLIQQELPLTTHPKKVDQRKLNISDVPQHKIILVNDPKSRQSQVYFYLKGASFGHNQYPYSEAFNTYFGESLTGVIFQEIREYRSLAYSTFGRYITPNRAGEAGYLITGFGCQSDKTNETIEVMIDLLKEFPSRSGRMESLRSIKMEEIMTNYPKPRQLGAKILEFQDMGFTEDPNEAAFNIYKELKISDLSNFYNLQFKDQPFIITIYGRKSDLDIKKLTSIGELVELKMSDIITD